jgi:glycosyltransferase involved in cell wall biosynthesis
VPHFPLADAAAALAERLRRRGTIVSHVVGHLAYGDAVSFDTVNKWRAMRALGIPGELYCGRPDDHHRTIARPLSAHRPSANELIVLHYSVWSEAAEYVQARTTGPVLLVYHNVTPERWFAGAHRQAEEDTRLGRAHLTDFIARSPFAIADSAYNRQELIESGYPASDVVPIMVDFEGFASHPSRAILDQYRDGYTNILSVGRIAPNKCHEDTIKLFYHYKRQINPRARLLLVGRPVVDSYHTWLGWLIRRLGLDPHVLLVGHVTNEDLAAFYELADAYVTMSEHEGFCVPLLEAMHAGTPTMGYASTAIPDTMGDAGVLLTRKDPAVAGELLDRLVSDTPLRRRLVAKGRERVETFAPARTVERFLGAVTRAIDLG